MAEENKYCSKVMKKHFNKKFVMTKEDSEDIENSTKIYICDNAYVDSDLKARNHCHITRKYIISVHRDCDINVKWNHKVPVVFHNLKNYDSHLIMQELRKFNLKINFLINVFQKYTSFNISRVWYFSIFKVFIR